MQKRWKQRIAGLGSRKQPPCSGMKGERHADGYRNSLVSTGEHNLMGRRHTAMHLQQGQFGALDGSSGQHRHLTTYTMQSQRQRGGDSSRVWVVCGGGTLGQAQLVLSCTTHPYLRPRWPFRTGCHSSWLRHPSRAGRPATRGPWSGSLNATWTTHRNSKAQLVAPQWRPGHMLAPATITRYG